MRATVFKTAEGVTPAQAAQAIRNYLTTGEPEWTRVVGATNKGE